MQSNVVKKIKNRLLIEFETHDKSGIYGYSQRVMAYNSNKLEGSTLTEKQTASIFETGTLYKENGVEYYITKDIEEATGHFKMFNHMLKTLNTELSPDLIKDFHKNLKEGVFEDYANGYAIGDWKKRGNRVADIITSTPDQVESEINKLLDEFTHKKLTIEDIAKFHAKFENIHPFQDGNGRVGRMIIIKQCLDNDIIPIIIKDEHKRSYLQYLNNAQTKHEYDGLVNFFKEEQKSYLIDTVDLIIDYDQISKFPSKEQFVDYLINDNNKANKSIADRIKESKSGYSNNTDKSKKPKEKEDKER